MENLPIKRKRDKSWKIRSGKVVFTCFTSDFLLSDAGNGRKHERIECHYTQQ